MIPIFVNLDNIKELKEIFTPYILTALKEKYMKTYQRTCLNKINEEYKKEKELVEIFVMYLNKISHYSPIYETHGWQYGIADFPKRFKYTSGMNCPTGFKELNS